MKRDFKAGAMIYPLPVALITCGRNVDEYNIFTSTWMGTISSDPPTCYISIKPERHSYNIIKESMEFVINLTTVEIVKNVDYCGLTSGLNINKFERFGLTAEYAKIVNAPIIKESPVNIECVVKSILDFNSHDMFIADIVNVKVDEELFDTNSSRINLNKADLLTFSYGNYYSLGEIVGKYGMSMK